jgi:hypothetical protein
LTFYSDYAIFSIIMTHAESSEGQPATLAQEIAALYADREVHRLALAEAGVHPERVARILRRDSLKYITRLAARYGESEELLALLTPSMPSAKQAPLQEWAERQYEEHGSDDIRSRQLPRGDRD